MTLTAEYLQTHSLSTHLFSYETPSILKTWVTLTIPVIMSTSTASSTPGGSIEPCYYLTNTDHVALPVREALHARHGCWGLQCNAAVAAAPGSVVCEEAVT